MPGAWELSRPEVLVAILTRELVTAAWASAFRNLIIPPGSRVKWVYGAPFDHARNECCLEALGNGYKYVFFLDDDVIPPPDTLMRLIDRKLPIVSGTYFRRNAPFAPVAQIKNARGSIVWLLKFQVGQLIEVDHVGAGCLLINRGVLENMNSPWFEWCCDNPDLPMHLRTSEDFTFCRKAKEAGLKIVLDTSIQCTHAGLSSCNIEGVKPLSV